MVLHQRQPYSVLVAVLFAPDETCDDGNPASKSDRQSPPSPTPRPRLRSGPGVASGQSWAPERARTSTSAPTTANRALRARVIGLYEQSGDDRGAVRFFDVEQPPPYNGRPTDAQTLSFDGLWRSSRPRSRGAIGRRQLGPTYLRGRRRRVTARSRDPCWPATSRGRAFARLTSTGCGRGTSARPRRRSVRPDGKDAWDASIARRLGVTNRGSPLADPTERRRAVRGDRWYRARFSTCWPRERASM